MHALSDTLRLLYITGTEPIPESERAASLSFDSLSADVSVATAVADVEATVADDDIDCLLVTGDAVDAFWPALHQFLRANPSLPAVVFLPDTGHSVLDDVLGLESAELIQSTIEETPEDLLRRRIAAVVRDNGGPTDTVDKYETVLNAAADTIYQLDTDGTIAAVNSAALELTGYSRDELIGEHVSMLVDEEDVCAGEAEIRRQLQTEDESVGTVEYTIETADGDRVPCETRLATLERDGQFVGSVGVVRDVSEKRERERELTRTRELLANAERLADVGAWEVDPDSGLQFWTDGTRRIHGVSEDFEPTIEKGVEFYVPDDRAEIERLVEQAISNAEPFDGEFQLETDDGETRWVRIHGEPLIEDGQVQKLRGFIQDITQLKERERELQEERDLIEHIYETSPTGIGVLDGNAIMQRANERAADIFGVDRESLLGKTYDEIPFEVTDADGNPIPPAEFPASRAIRTGEPRYNDEVQIHRPDGDALWVSFNSVPIHEDGTVHRVLSTMQDVTDRRERAEKIASQRDELAMLNRINSIIRDVDEALLEAESREEILQAVCSRFTESDRYQFALALEAVGGRLDARVWADGATTFVDGVFPIDGVTAENSPAVRTIETGEVEVIRDVVDDDRYPTAKWREDALDADVRSLAALPLEYGKRNYGVITIYATEPDAFTERELAVLDELGGTVAHAIAAVESREREATLTSLYETTQDLLAAESRQEVSDVVVETAADVLTFSGVGLFLFDDDDNVLRPAAATDELLEFYGDSVVFGPGEADSVTWRAYATGETLQFDDIRTTDRLTNPDTDARGTLFVPLGDHGVFVGASTTIGAFDEETQNLVGLLAATTEAALDRVTGRMDIRERDQELARRARRLEQTKHILDCFRDVDGLLRRAGTRTAIEEGVCNRLAEGGEHTFVWMGTVAPDGDRLVPRAWAGEQDGYLDDVSLETGSDEPAVRTAMTGEMTHFTDVTDHLQDEPWTRAAVDRNVQSAIAVPLVYGDTTYGVLAMYAGAPDAFEGLVAEVLPELGERIAHSINTVETKRGVLAEQFTELELTFEGSDRFLNAVAAIADEPVSYREITPAGRNTARVLFALSDPPVEEVLALESEYVSVQSLSHTERRNEHIFRATLSGRTITATLLDCGGIPQDVVKTATETRAVVKLSQQLDVRVFLERVREAYPTVELVRREDNESQSGPEDIRVALDQHLTDRQREVLLTAFESGFFQSPRETTGSELAEMLDISQPTVTHHLREAQNRLFSALFDGVEKE